VSTTSRIAKVVEELVAEREHLSARIAKVDAAIATMQDLFHLPDAPRAQARRNKKDPASDHKRSSRKGSSNGHGELSADAIRAALKQGPLSPGALAEQLAVERSTLRYHLKQLEEDGLVVSTGVTAGRRVALAPHRTAKEAP
jgi:DNA-binding transcriptional ArsR family regulator